MNVCKFPLYFRYVQYLLGYDNKLVGLVALKKTDKVKFSYSLN
jgi:hypothetical protein